MTEQQKPKKGPARRGDGPRPDEPAAGRSRSRRHSKTLTTLVALGGFGGLSLLLDAVGRWMELWQRQPCDTPAVARSADELQGSRQLVERAGLKAEARDGAGCKMTSHFF
jgi:hypothetical protein